MAMVSKRKFVTSDPEKCVGCGICELVCSYQKAKVFNPIRSRIRIVRLPPSIYLSVTCRLCEDPACVAACPREAIISNPDTGVLTIDKDKCNGCGWCVEACEFGAITLDPETKVMMACDLCEERPEGPMCIEWCPEEALDLMTRETLAEKARIASAKKLFAEVLKREAAATA